MKVDRYWADSTTGICCFLRIYLDLVNLLESSSEDG